MALTPSETAANGPNPWSASKRAANPHRRAGVRRERPSVMAPAMTTIAPMATRPASPGPPGQVHDARAEQRRRPRNSARSARPHRRPTPRRRRSKPHARGLPGRRGQPRQPRRGGRPGGGRRRSRTKCDDDRHRTRHDHGDRGEGRWAVQRLATVVGASLGGSRHPLKPPSTSCGGPRSTGVIPLDDLGRHRSWYPSPRTSQHPSGQAPTVSDSIGAARLVDDHRRPAARGDRGAASGSASTTWSTCSPVGLRAVVRSRWAPGASDTVPGSHGVAVDGRPVRRRSATAP